VTVVEPLSVCLGDDADRTRGQAYVALGAVAWSSAGILQRELSVGPATQLGGRALFAGIALLVFVAITRRAGGILHAFRGIGRTGIVVALSMAVSSSTFILALNYSTVARVLFLTALAPLAAALLARLTLGERIDPRTWIAMLIALVGVVVMLSSHAGGSRRGDVLSIVCMFAFAATIVVTRHRRDVSMAPATCLSQLLLAVVALPFAHPGSATGKDLLLFLALGIGQTGLGLILLTSGARLIPAAQTALISMLELVLGPLWVWLAYSEQPGVVTIVGGAIVLAGILFQIGDPARVLQRA
jgi:drug/metabolite transporter (DMT)-like permease